MPIINFSSKAILVILTWSLEFAYMNVGDNAKRFHEPGQISEKT